MDTIAKLLEKAGIKFTMTAPTLVLIVGLITGIVILYVRNNKLETQIETIPTLKDRIETLEGQNNVLAGKVATYDKLLETFMENPPIVLKTEIDRLDAEIKRHHKLEVQPVNNTPVNTTPTLPDVVNE